MIENTNPQENTQNQASSDTSDDNPELVLDETSTEATANSEQSNNQETQVNFDTPDNSRSPGKDRGL